MQNYIKFHDTDCKFIVHGSNGLILLHDVGCHNEIIALTVKGSVLHAIPKGKRTVNAISRIAAWLALNADQTAMSPYEYFPKLTGIGVPVLDPYKVKGTGVGSSYVVVAATPFGYVARKDSDSLKIARIRVVKTLVDSWPKETTGNILWETVTNAHMSRVAIGPESIAITIACGVDTLLTLGKVG